MNVEAVLKRLAALEEKLGGNRHIESVFVGALSPDGQLVPCFDADSYTGKYTVIEHIFIKVNKCWEYRPNRKIIDDFRDYCPPTDYHNRVVYLVRTRHEIKRTEAAREAIDEAMRAVAETGTSNDYNQ